MNGKTILITGGTGSFGKRFIKKLLNSYDCKKIIIYSRDELKQFEMREELISHKKSKCLRFFIGDIRDKSRLMTDLNNVDYEIHSAALKQIETEIKKRDKSRKEKNYKESDLIRDELLGKGIELKDTIDGTQWSVKL